jgi:hypothetical protein
MHKVTFLLLVIGGLNWLLTAFGYNVVEMLLGAGSSATMVVYVIIGLATIYEIFTHMKNCKCCDKMGKMA